MRRRVKPDLLVNQSDAAVGEDTGNRQFITALARGLDVVRCFRRGEGPLSNQEIARRTDLPRPTISRIIYTLRDLGYLRYYPKTRTYGLGGAAYVLGQIADQNFDPIGAIRPILQRYAQATGANVGLSTRERLNMIYVEACEGASLVGLQLRVGDTISLTSSAIGLAYLAALDDADRSQVLKQLKRDSSIDLDQLQSEVAVYTEQLQKHGFCLSLGKMRSEINGVTVPVSAAKLDGVYVLSAGGPAYALSERKLIEETGPLLVRAARELQDAVGLRSFAPSRR